MTGGMTGRELIFGCAGIALGAAIVGTAWTVIAWQGKARAGRVQELRDDLTMAKARATLIRVYNSCLEEGRKTEAACQTEIECVRTAMADTARNPYECFRPYKAD
jgi:hypothetical protein